MAIKILHVLDHSLPLHSGYVFRTLAILREQRVRGWETIHVTSPKHRVAEAPIEQIDGLTFHRTFQPNGLWAALPVANELQQIALTARTIARVVRDARPDILQASSPVLNALAALRVGRRFGIPVVYEVRALWEDAAAANGATSEGGPRYRLSRAVETYALKRVDAVTTICEGLRREIVERGIPADKVTVIPNAVDVTRFVANTARDETLARRFGLAGRTVLGFLGSFYPYEGLDLAIAALPEVLRAIPEATLLLVGGGPAEEDLKALTQRLGVSERVVFAGRVSQDEIARYYGLVDLLVYPRRSMRLTELVTPLKPLEAMAQKRAFLASDVGGHRELVRDGETGFLFRAGDRADLARKIVSILAARERWPAVLEAGRDFVEKERNWARSVARYQPVYERLRAGRR